MVNSNGNNGDSGEAEYLRKIFIGGLTSTTTDDGLQSYFEKWGTVVDSVVMKDPKTKKSRGFGFITYSDSSMVDAAQQARPHTIDGRTIEAKRAVPREDVGRPEISAPSQKIYVGRLDDGITEDVLRQHFEQFGTIKAVNIVCDKEGKPRGFGFVEFDDYDPVDKLVLQKDHHINGKSVDVKKSQPKQNDGDRRQGGAGGGGGGGRNQGNQSGGFRGNNSGGNNSWGRNQGSNFGGNPWNQNSGSGGGYNNGNSAWANNSGNSGWGGNNGNNAWGNNSGGFGSYGNDNSGNGGGNFGNSGFGGNSGGGNFGSYGNQPQQQYGSGGGNFGVNKQFNSGGGGNFRNSNNFGGNRGSGPIRGQQQGNRQQPYGNNRNFNN